MPWTPWHPLPPEPQPCYTQTRGDAAPHSMGGPGIQALGQGYPQTGHPGHLPGSACAPAALCCVPSHRGSAALCLVKPIMHRLYSSPPQRPLLPGCSAWHGPGARGSPRQSVRVIPVVGANPHSGSAPPAHPILGTGWSPKPQEESLSPHLKLHPLSSPSLEGSLPSCPVLSNPPVGEPGRRGPPCFPHPRWV